MTNETPPAPSPQLADFRQQIDELDDKLIQLLKERIGIVSQVGAMKSKTNPGQCPLRPGREADMVRRIAKAFEGSAFAPAAAVAMWRTLIGASTAVEGSLKISVFADDKNNTLYWLAREYFGPFIPVMRQPHINRVLGDVIDGKAAVGLVPNIYSSDANNWWTALMQPDANMPVVFAHVPFVYYETPGNNAPSALAIARIKPEKTAEDISLVILESDNNTSQNRMQQAFATAKLEARWINIVTLHSSARHHVLEIKGFITTEHKGMQEFLKAMGPSILKTTYLGAYAVPFTLTFSNADQPKAAHASAKA